jgi:hypothetical protein
MQIAKRNGNSSETQYKFEKILQKYEHRKIEERRIEKRATYKAFNAISTNTLRM